MFYEQTKRAMDLAISLVALVILSPVFIVVAIAIFLQDGGSPLYSHERVGLKRQEFTFYKFRSMVKNADAILYSNRELYEKMRSGTNKVKDDFRVTKIGKFIRKYSIDELPQLFNVLSGLMSFVGPRALRPDELKKYEAENPQETPYLDKVLSVKPGITGYWQVSGRSKIPFDKRIRMEAEYAGIKSIKFDIIIILKTPLAVLRAEGAC
ncbi:sugar transferase [Candidatus Parcubacteria bacterium]|nr:sugar transferase [Candidatus Parcubacteria bacterium]